MTRLPLTERQQQVYQLIRASLRERGVPPSFREIRDGIGIRSTNGVRDHLLAIERKGWIVLPSPTTARGGISRGIRLVDDERLDLGGLTPSQIADVKALVEHMRQEAA